ncbi:MAG: hypothetical protein QM770_11495 [Tepidisphaeraceae bacterium]
MSAGSVDNLAGARSLIERVAWIRRKHALVQIALGGSTMLLATLVGLGVSMWLDAAQHLSFAARGTLLFVLLIALALLAWRFIIVGLWRTPDLEQAALWVERSMPEAGSRLISAVQFARGGSGHASPAMVRALIDEAEELVADRDLSSVVRSDAVVATFCSAFALLVLGVGVLGYLGPYGEALLKRAVLVPGVELPTNTSIEWLNASPLRVARGEDLSLQLRAAARFRNRVHSICGRLPVRRLTSN